MKRPFHMSLTLLVVSVALLCMAGVAQAGTPPQTNIPIDGTPDLENVDWPRQNHPITAQANTLAAASLPHELRDPDITLTLYSMDASHPGAYDVPFWKEFSGTHSDIYIGWDNLTSGPKSLQQDQAITDQQIDIRRA